VAKTEITGKIVQFNFSTADEIARELIEGAEHNDRN